MEIEIGAIATAVVSLVVAVYSVERSWRTSGRLEDLRHSHEVLTRLRGATGALRLQTFLATRSLVRRMGFYVKSGCDPMRAYQQGGTETEYHHGGLFIYRLLRPLALSYMIEQETFYADLPIDPNMVDLLRLNHAAFEMLTGERIGEAIDPSLGFDMRRCWDPDGHAGAFRSPTPFQRVRASYLRSAAAALAADEEGNRSERRCRGHDAFLEAWEHPDGDEFERFHQALAPLKAVVDGFSPRANPVFWLRVVGYAYVCDWFVDRVRADTARRAPEVSYQPVVLPLEEMLAATGQPSISANADALRAKFDEIIEQSL